MALFSECSPKCARKVLDTADIVREAIHQHCPRSESGLGKKETYGPAVDCFAMSALTLSTVYLGEN